MGRTVVNLNPDPDALSTVVQILGSEALHSEVISCQT